MTTGKVRTYEIATLLLGSSSSKGFFSASCVCRVATRLVAPTYVRGISKSYLRGDTTTCVVVLTCVVRDTCVVSRYLRGIEASPAW